MKIVLNKRTRYIIILLTLLFIFNIAMSFAYIRGGTIGNESQSTVALTGGNVYVKYVGNSPDIIVNDIIPGFETTKKFTVTSEYGSNHAYYKESIWYTIALAVDYNEFDDGSIICSVYADNASDNDGILAKSSDISIPSGKNQKGINLASGRFDNNGMNHVYNLKISYPETGTNQSHMVNSKFQAHVILKDSLLINLTFNLDGGSLANFNLNSSSTIKVPSNSTINLPVPTKDGFSFIGWEILSGNVSVNNNLISINESDITLRALWSEHILYEFAYTGAVQQFTAEQSGYYKMEAWGAQGGKAVSKGGYTSGVLLLQKNDILYVYVGQGNNITANGTSFNSGTANQYGWPGGGSTDIRLVGGNWNNITSLRSRVMVAGGSGAGEGNNKSSLGAGGGLNGYAGGGTAGGTQTSFGSVQASDFTVSSFGIANGGCPGGNGYYPGGAAYCSNGAGGGSSFISGHTGCVAVVSSTSTTARTGTNGASCTTGTSDNLCSVHYSGKVFTDTVMIDGAGYAWTNTKGALQQMPNPSGGYYGSGVGHGGNGYARITYLHS